MSQAFLVPVHKRTFFGSLEGRGIWWLSGRLTVFALK
jgi:hypothetical protein